MYTCPKRRQSISTEIKKVIWHLREVQTLSDGQDLIITCNHIASGTPEAETSNNEETPDTVLFKAAIPSDCVASFVAKMYSSSNMTLMDVTRSVTCTQEVLQRTVESLQQSTNTLLNNLQVSLNSESVRSSISEFENAKQIFKDVDTPFKMNKYFAKKFVLVRPKETFLGHRAETARKQGQVKQVLAADTCQYISVIETIKFIFSSKQMQRLYLQNERQTEGKMYSCCVVHHCQIFTYVFCLILWTGRCISLLRFWNHC